jgi:hypothetical protein
MDRVLEGVTKMFRLLFAHYKLFVEQNVENKPYWSRVYRCYTPSELKELIDIISKNAPEVKLKLL